jgi:hypothetical protein
MAEGGVLLGTLDGEDESPELEGASDLQGCRRRGRDDRRSSAACDGCAGAGRGAG